MGNYAKAQGEWEGAECCGAGAVHAAIRDSWAAEGSRHSQGRTEDGLRTHGAAPTVGDAVQLAYFHGLRSTRSRLSGGVR